MRADPVDLRAQRTRTALLGAFFPLVESMRYDDIRVAHIVARSGVSRSAFYAHFANKDALLAASIAGPFAVLADTLRSDDAVGLTRLLDHFWSQRPLARTVLAEPIRRRVAAVLTDQVERILDDGGAWKRGPLILPSRLAAVQFAEMLLAPVSAWLAGESRCSSETLAIALRAVAVRALDGLVRPDATMRR
jgi:AcrR family transcriptional regulator